MLHTLILRLQGPVQTWGTAGSQFDYTRTEHRPTKSGVIGLVANAMGRVRDDDISDLAGCLFSVRADIPGTVATDYRTAGGGSFPADMKTWAEAPRGYQVDDLNRISSYGAPTTSNNFSYAGKSRTTVLRHRELIMGAGYCVGLTGPAELIDVIEKACEVPARPVFLGAKACPPSHPLVHQRFMSDEHVSWARTLDRLDGAVVTAPFTWREEPSSEAVMFNELPVSTVNGGKRGVLLRQYTVDPTTHVETPVALT